MAEVPEGSLLGHISDGNWGGASAHLSYHASNAGAAVSAGAAATHASLKEVHETHIAPAAAQAGAHLDDYHAQAGEALGDYHQQNVAAANAWHEQNVSAPLARAADDATEWHQQTVLSSALFKVDPDVPKFGPFVVEAVRIAEIKRGAGGLSVEVYPKVSHEMLPVQTTAVVRKPADFAALRTALAREWPGAIVPPLPACTATTYMITEDDITDTTSQAFETFLKRVLAHRELAQSFSLKGFVLATEEVWMHMRKSLGQSEAVVAKPVSTILTAHTERAYEHLGVHDTAENVPEHVVRTEADGDVAKHVDWASSLEQHVATVTARAKVMQRSANKAATERAFFSSNALDMAATQDDSYNPMGLNKLRATAEAAKAQAGHAVPVLLGQLADLAGYVGAVKEACAAREEARLHLQAAKLQLSNAEHSLKAGELHKVQAERIKTAAAHKSKVAGGAAAAPASPTQGKVGVDVGAIHLTCEQEDSAKEVFDMFDADGSGSISMRELRYAFQAMGKKVTQADLDKMMQAVDKDDNGEIDYEEFLALIAPLIAGKAHSLDDAMAAFTQNVDATAAAETAQVHAGVMALQAKAAFHGALLSTKSTPEDVANFGLLVDDLTEELEVITSRLLHEADAFHGSVVPRLKLIFVEYFKVEHFYCQQQRVILTDLVKELGGRERQISNFG